MDPGAEAMGSGEVVLGLDIGGTNTAMGLVERDGRCLAELTLPTGKQGPAGAFFERLGRQAKELLGAIGPAVRLVAVGLGAPNANHARGTIDSPPNLDWGQVDLQRDFAPHFAAPWVATNDANAAALGEMLYGSARGMKDFIAITLGTGLGSGIVANGELVYGATGLAGEMGHLLVVPQGRACGCGRRGCLETYVSATGLVTTVKDLLGVGDRPSRLRAIAPDALTARAVFEAADTGDPLAVEAFEATGERLGRCLADAVAFTSPEAILLLGGLAAAGEWIFGPTRRALEANLMDCYRGSVRLLPSGVAGGNPAILGAAALAWKELGGS
jgi:glucokinase